MQSIASVDGSKRRMYNFVRNREVQIAIFSMPEWRNWKTRGTQNPVPARACGFDPLLRYQNPHPPYSSYHCIYQIPIMAISEGCRLKLPSIQPSSGQRADSAWVR